MTKANKPTNAKYANVDLHELLRERRQVAVIWSTEDVIEVRPDLTDDQAWKVLQECDRKHSCDEGFTWQLIETIADGLFGPAP